MATKGMGFLDSLSTATKAVLATAVIGLPEFPTIVTAGISAAGVGAMPPEADLQRALVQVLMALIGGLLVYQMPNASAAEVAEKKEAARQPEDNPDIIEEPVVDGTTSPLRPRPRPPIEVAHS
jgi:hypothetical protein